MGAALLFGFRRHWQEQRCQELLTQLLQLTSFVKMLGLTRLFDPAR